MNRTTACCLKCGWNPDEQVRRRALPLVKGADGLLHKDISTTEEAISRGTIFYRTYAAGAPP